MYIKLTKKKVNRTVEVSNRLFVDLDKENNLRGLEIPFVSKALKDTDFTKLEFQLPRTGEIILNLPAPAK